MKYEYQHDFPFEAYLTNLGKYNEGELIGEWVKFPVQEEILHSVLKRIGINAEYEEYFISDYDIYVPHLNPMVLGEYPRIEDLNTLAEGIENLSTSNYLKFIAILEFEDGIEGMDGYLSILNHLEAYFFYPMIQSTYDLGYYYVEECFHECSHCKISQYVDYVSLGEELASLEDGYFSDQGYVVRV